MPGLRKDVNTSSWKVSDWRNARKRNLALLLGWIVFFSLIVRSGLAPDNWYMLAPTLLIAVIGGLIQVVWLVRISIWLDNQKKLRSEP